MSIVTPNLRSSQKCGTPFEPRSGSGGSVQRFCCTVCRLDFHKERLRSQRRACTLGRSPEPAISEPDAVFEQAERLPLDQRRRLVKRLLATIPPEKSETEPALPLPLPSAPPNNASSGFAEFYRVYPLHVARGAAERAYRRIIKNGEATQADLLAGAMRYAAAQDGKDPTYVKHPATWLNGKCWRDEPAPGAAHPRGYLDSIRAGLALIPDEGSSS